MKWTGAMVVGTVMAAAPAFSGLALLVVLLVGGAVAVPLFAAGLGRADRPGLLTAWLWWLAASTTAEVLVLLAGDDLRWPTFSAIQDPVTTAEPLGRFAAGALWSLAGSGLLSLRSRWDGAHSIRRGAAVALPLVALALTTIDDGAMLSPRDAPAVRAVGIVNTAVVHWPATAWLTIAAFATLAVAALVLHLRGRTTVPPGAIPDVLAWLMGAWPGRVLGFAGWLWCGWHFLAR